MCIFNTLPCDCIATDMPERGEQVSCAEDGHECYEKPVNLDDGIPGHGDGPDQRWMPRGWSQEGPEEEEHFPRSSVEVLWNPMWAFQP